MKRLVNRFVLTHFLKDVVVVFVLSDCSALGCEIVSHDQPVLEMVLLDKDGDVYEFLVKLAKGDLTVITTVEVVGNVLILRDLHVDGAGPGTSSFKELRQTIKAFGRSFGTQTVVIHGFARTTGAKPGHVPRPIIVRLEP